MTQRRTDLSQDERERYARHLVLSSLGEAGQRRLKSARVLVVGAGGLGSAATLYLAAAGVGQIGLVDDDAVTRSNLQRQILHGERTLDRLKIDSARDRLADLNSHVVVETFAERFTPETGSRIASDYDLIVDGTDNFETRYAINDVCLDLGIPYVYGAVSRWEGQASLLCSGGPCYRCVFPEPPQAGAVTPNEQAGVLSSLPGTIGTIQATEAIKWIVGIETPLVGRLLVYDAAAMRFEEIGIEPNPGCPGCAGQRER